MTIIIAESDNMIYLLLGIGALVLAGFSWMASRNRAAAIASERLLPNEHLERARQMGGVKNDVREAMVELEELTRHFSAQLDAKSIKLEQLIEEADAAIRRMESMGGTIAAAESNMPATATAPVETDTATDTDYDETDSYDDNDNYEDDAAYEDDDSYEESGDRNEIREDNSYEDDSYQDNSYEDDSYEDDSYDDDVPNDESDSSQASPAPNASTEMNPVPSGDEELAGKIYALADEGKQPVEIAKELGEDIGKVDLVLALRQ